MDSSVLTEYIERFRDGDTSVLVNLYEATYRRVYYIAYYISKNYADAQDITQDTYIKAFSKLNTLNDSKAFPAWISEITRNTAINYIKRRHTDIIDEENDVLTNIIFEKDGNPEDIAEKHETKYIVLQLIDNLPQEQRRAILLYYYERMNAAEIAEEENVPVSTITSRLAYARSSLRRAVMSYERSHGVKLFSGSFAMAMAAISTTVPTAILSPTNAAAVLVGVMNALGINFAAHEAFQVISEITDSEESAQNTKHRNFFSRFIDNIRISFKGSLIVKVNRPTAAAVGVLSVAILLFTVIIGSGIISRDNKITDVSAKKPAPTDQPEITVSTPVPPDDFVTVSDYYQFITAVADGTKSIHISGTLYADRTAVITNDITISGGTISRLNLNTGDFFDDCLMKIGIGCSVILGDIVFDGACRDENGTFIRRASPMISVMNSASLTLDGTVLRGNSTSYQINRTGGFGGAVIGYNPKLVYITGDTVIEDNISVDSGGGIYLSGGNLLMDGGTLRRNISSMCGGAIAAEKMGKITIAGGALEYNSSDYYKNQFRETPKQTYSGRGGAVHLAKNCTLEISDGMTIGNTAADFGGGYFLEHGCTAKISGGVFEYNSSRSDGGVFYARYSDVIFSEYPELQSNNAVFGGAICCYGGNMTISGGTFSYNTAAKLGGVFYADICSNVILDGGLFEKNNAVSGAVFFIKKTPSELRSGVFRQNYASADGGVGIVETENLILKGGTITENTAECKYGAIAAIRQGVITIHDESSAVIKDNIAQQYANDIASTD